MIRGVFAGAIAAAVIIFASCKSGPEFGVVHEEKLDTNRLVKVELASGFDEPMEIAVTGEGKVIIIERKGGIKLYDPALDSAKDAGTLPVYSGQEDGLLGLAIDPEFDKNKFIYLYYSPVGDEAKQRVSRFVFEHDSLQQNSEKILIEIPTQRQECCHSAGSLAFGPGGNLFIAVGDNTNPHNPGYYNSTDEREGREYWDAQRTAGNTNDLRGKILRIHPEADGSYTIPKGNLFAEGTEKARPEIYVMGTRNPYRIGVDQKNGWLYWGDVGQNTVDDPKRGPISYDEWNLAREAGFFGWPYFAGPNSAYAAFNWETNEIGPFFDPAKPRNTSVNNTGLTDLPPAQKALIYYSYDESKEFAHLGTGGKSPIGGPVFYTDLYKERINDTTRHLHEYYNGKVFIAEWMRDWINVLTVDSSGKLDTIEPFMPGTKFNHPIELEFGPDGMLYILEYGTNWFAKNKDAGLFRIEYRRTDQTDTTQNKTVKNAEPEIFLNVKNGNRSFYWPGTPIEYSIEVTDEEDGSLQNGTINADQVKISRSFSTMGPDMAMVVQAHETVTAAEPTLPSIQNSDCKACHSMDQKSVGPSYRAIADRYSRDRATVDKLAQKIISGGVGNWGNEHAMSAHPQLSLEQAREMVNYILALNDPATGSTRIAAEGKFTPTAKDSREKGDYIITVSYKDKEQQGVASNEARRIFYIRNPQVAAAGANNSKGTRNQGTSAVDFVEQGSWIMFREIDITGISSIDITYSNGKNPGSISVKIGTVEGEEIGHTPLSTESKNAKSNIKLKKTDGVYDVYFVYKGDNAQDNSATGFALKSIIFNK